MYISVVYVCMMLVLCIDKDISLNKALNLHRLASMPKGENMTITLKDVGSGYKRSAINENFDTIESELNNNVLRRDSATGNQMEANIDLNSNRVINSLDGVSATDLTTVRQVTDAINTVVTAGQGNPGTTDNILHEEYATNQNLETYLQNGHVVNVKDFGAVGDGVTDNTLAFEACRDYCIANSATMHVPDGLYKFAAGDLDLWGVHKINCQGSLIMNSAIDNVIIGGSTVAAPSMDVYVFGVYPGILKVHGMNRGNLKVILAQTLHLYASDAEGGSYTRKTVSYSRFEFVNVDNLHLECQDTLGQTPWMNENKFYCGRVRNSLTLDGTYPMNNNIFYGIGLESAAINIDNGCHDNYFYDVRLEAGPHFTFGAGTFNNIFWVSWANFANIPMWGGESSVYDIVDNGNNNRVVPVHDAYLHEEVLVSYDAQNLEDTEIFGVSATPNKIEILQASTIICDTGLLPASDKMWFNVTGAMAGYGARFDITTTAGVITGAAIATAGMYYEVGDLLRIKQAVGQTVGSGGIFTVSSVNTTGGVTGITLTAGGVSYSDDEVGAYVFADYAYRPSMGVYDKDGNAITTEPVGFKESQGPTNWNVGGFWDYGGNVPGGNFSFVPHSAPEVAYVRFWVQTGTGTVGDLASSFKVAILQPKKSQRKIANVGQQDTRRIDTLSNKVTTTLESAVLDLLKFTSYNGTISYAAGVIQGELDIALTGVWASGSTYTDAAGAKVPVLITREHTGAITITTGTPVYQSNGGTLQINSVTLGTKAGATIAEAIMTIQIGTNQADPHVELNARARLVGLADWKGSSNYNISVEKV